MLEFADDPILAAGYEYWRSLPRTADIPDTRDVDPAALPKQIRSNAALIKIVGRGTDAVICHVGREFEEHFGFSLKGKTTVSLTEGHYRDYMLNHYRILMEWREAVYSESAFRWDCGGHFQTRRLMMPLSDGTPDVVAMAFKLQTWPREEMRGLPFCEVIANCDTVENLEPQFVRRKYG